MKTKIISENPVYRILKIRKYIIQGEDFEYPGDSVLSINEHKFTDIEEEYLLFNTRHAARKYMKNVFLPGRNPIKFKIKRYYIIVREEK